MQTTLLITQQCNEQCQYCDLQYVAEPLSTTLDKVKKWLPKILARYANHNRLDFDILGGEVGLLDPTITDTILQICDNWYTQQQITAVISIYTNGLYFKTHASILQKKYVSITVVYNFHLVRFSDFYKPEVDNIIYNIVSTPDIMKDIINLAVEHPSAKFIVNPQHVHRVRKLPPLSLHDCYYMLALCGSTPNIETKMLKNVIKNFESPSTLHKLKCAFKNMFAFDLVNETIHNCCLSYHDTQYPLTEILLDIIPKELNRECIECNWYCHYE